MEFYVGDQVRRYDFPDTGEVRRVLSADQVVVYWPDDPRRRSLFTLEWTEQLAKVENGAGVAPAAR